MHPKIYYSEVPNTRDYLTFDKTEIVTVNVKRLAEDLVACFDECFEYQGISDSDTDCINIDKVKLAVAKKWIAECLEKGLTS